MRSFTVGRIWGIPVRLNVSMLIFLPVLAYLIGSGAQIDLYTGVVNGFSAAQLDLATLKAGNTPWLIGALAAVGLFVSVLLHELGHSWVAMRYGIGIRDITLWIFGGVASLESIPREWNREFWIAVAGPAVSVATGAVCLLATRAIPGSMPVVLFVVGWLGVTNVVLAVFNMVPAFPMDGGRVLRALLARTRPYGLATRTAARVGVWFAVLFAVVGALGLNVVLLLMALFVYGAAKSESQAVLVDELLEGFTAGDLADREAPRVAADATLDDLVDRMLRARRTVFPVERDGDVIGIVTLDDVKAGRRGERESTSVASLVREDVLRVDAADDAFETLIAMQRGGDGYALVEADGRTVGLLTQAEFANAFEYRRTMGAGPEARGVV